MKTRIYAAPAVKANLFCSPQLEDLYLPTYLIMSYAIEEGEPTFCSLLYSDSTLRAEPTGVTVMRVKYLL